MGKSEIKLRRNVLNPLDIERYRDYSALLKRHDRDRKRRRALRFFAFSLIITLIVVLFLVIITFLWFRIQNRHQVKDPKGITSVHYLINKSNSRSAS